MIYVGGYRGKKRIGRQIIHCNNGKIVDIVAAHIVEGSVYIVYALTSAPTFRYLWMPWANSVKLRE